jgi:serine-type D-Ala-D-Ala carboxypeptidase (penicillin-binding protein 5/6)
MLFPVKQALQKGCLPAIVFFAMAGMLACAGQRHPLERDIDQVVRAKSALLIDAKTGEILYARNKEQHLAPASTVKLLTALLVYENKGLGGSITVVPSDQAEPSNVPLVPGETVAVRDLAYSLLLGSDNDSARALGRYVGGDLDDFISMMNARAIRLGCRNSCFKSPNGLPTPGQYTTAEDLMKIFQAFVNIPELRRIASTKSYYLKTAARSQTLKNHNKLLGVYPGMGPAKTGWTYASRHTYAASVTQNGHELFLTILDSPNKWSDATALFNYGFAHLTPSEPEPTTTTAAASSPAMAPATPASSAQTPASAAAPATESTPTTAPAAPATQAPAVAAPASATPPATTQASTPRTSQQTHVIRRGETLSSIAQAYDCTAAQLARLNRINDPRSLQPGQKLVIP